MSNMEHQLPAAQPGRQSIEENMVPFVPMGRWRDPKSFAMRRILTLFNDDKTVAGFRPLIQQGHGDRRKNHSTVFRVGGHFSEELALKSAQTWRDKKEVELGLSGGAPSSKAAACGEHRVFLVVTKTAPYRALWTSSITKNGKRPRIYIGGRSYQESYEVALSRVYEIAGLAMPATMPSAPAPTPEQFVRLKQIGVIGLPSCESLAS